MKLDRLLLAGVMAAGLVACESGGVTLNVSTVDNSVDNSTSTGGGDNGNNPCASYTDPQTNAVRRGTFDGQNCTYGPEFVGVNNPLRANVTIPFISGVHIFQDALFVGESVSSGRAPQEGEGPTLTIQAGNRIAFLDAADYVLINRGAKIVADGSPTAPIIFSGYTDLVTRTAGPEDVQLWGGIVINGNGITNNCSDAERANNQCHVESEGQPSYYGGDNNAESSGVLRYVIVKHAGFEVAPDDELNGITFNAVGSGTVVENLQIYAAYDDGVEMFGGAVNIKNLVVMYARDDSLDFSDGWVGTVENALVIHAANDGNHCIELDNIGAARSSLGASMVTPPVTLGTVRNMTCILSNNIGGTHGNSIGVITRQGGRLVLENSIIYGGYATAILGRTSNQGYRFASTESIQFAVAGESRVNNTIFAMQNPGPGTLAPVNGDAVTTWLTGGGAYTFNTGNKLITDPASANVSLLQPGTFFTAGTLRDADGNPIALPPGEQIGAVRANADWTSPWAYGIRAGNRGQPLWFQQ
jgi:hypothetical protein